MICILSHRFFYVLYSHIGYWLSDIGLDEPKYQISDKISYRTIPSNHDLVFKVTVFSYALRYVNNMSPNATAKLSSNVR
mgnify:FL=1